MKDELTGLLNRRFLIEQLDKLLEKTNNPVFSLLFIDTTLKVNKNKLKQKSLSRD